MNFLKTTFGSVTFRQSTVTFSATFLNGILGLAFFGLLAQVLGVAAFGLFSVTIEVLALVASIADLGTDTGLVKFIGKYRKNDPTEAQKYLKVGLLIKLLVSLVISIVGWFASPFLAEFVFQKPELTLGLRLAAIGVATSLLFTFMTAALQGFQYFKAWGGLQISTNLLRLLLLIVLGSLATVNFSEPDLLPQSLIIYISAPAFGFILGFFFISPSFMKVKGEYGIWKKFLHYNKWVAAFTLIAALSSRLDIFLAARILDVESIGLYAAASRLALVGPQIATAVGTVIAPKMAEQTTLSSFLHYFKKVQLMVAGLCVLGLCALPVSVVLLPIVFGVEFSASVPIFWVLLVAMLVFIFSVPVHAAVLYYFSNSKLFFWQAIGHFALIGVLGWYLLSGYGAIGIAFAVLCGATFNFIVPTVWLYRKVKVSK
ncbi:MAG: hypothetical protein US96_C0006G0012 [Candidatus Woesebacteria bacterium GW2011_GWB1_38_5b]|uniref:Polysaccharide biosynthesis protein n=1 Tax=Candidatus Woesebacteria bacterium GW2011_GWB1_38_5b TaxID=1618569 RepID=A0A0G0KJL6_9BACT|nr:MAG: hypothetical protein US96_C0006G0012 [Candidatus Woesebacteria bacterium GW2011_GWB1_38_5b]